MWCSPRSFTSKSTYLFIVLNTPGAYILWSCCSYFLLSDMVNTDFFKSLPPSYLSGLFRKSHEFYDDIVFFFIVGFLAF